MINLNSPDLFSANEAAAHWGKTGTYVRQMLYKYPNKFPAGSVRKFGSTIVVTREAMIALTGHDEIKKKTN